LQPSPRGFLLVALDCRRRIDDADIAEDQPAAVMLSPAMRTADVFSISSSLKSSGR
jgi:hypothetical protein